MEADKSYSILIVDDERDVRDTLAEGLELQEFEVDSCANPDEIDAKMKSRSGGFDFMVLDQRFGQDSSRGAREIPRLKKSYPACRIIVLTGIGERESCIEALTSGADRYVPKPVDPVQVGDVIQAMIDIAPFEEELLAADGVPEGLLGGLLANADLGISVVDRTFHIVYVNAKQREMMDERACVGGICWVEYNDRPEQIVPCPWCPTRSTFDDGLPHKGITPSPVKGQERKFEVRSFPLTDAGGRVVGAVEIVEDITERENLHLMQAELLGARSLDQSLHVILGRLVALGFDRARLYLSSADGKAFVGHSAIPDVPGGIRNVKLDFDEDPYSQAALSLTEPHIYRRGDLGGEEKHDTVLDKKDVDEWMEIPLRVDNRCIGKMGLDNKLTRRPLTGVASEVLMEFAESAAEAIARAKEATERQRMQELERRLLEASTHEERFDILAGFCGEIVGALSCHIRRLREDELVLTGSSDRFPPLVRRRNLQLDDSVSLSCRTVRENRRVMICTQEGLGPLKVKLLGLAEDREKVEAYLQEMRASASFPLTFRGEAIGSLVVDAGREDFFSPDTCAKIQSLADRAARLIGTGEQLEHIEACLQTLPIPVMVTSIGRTVLMVNEAMRQLLAEAGLAAHAGTKCYTLLAARKEACPDCPRVLAERTGAARTKECAYEIGGRKRTFSVICAPVQGEDGQSLGAIETYHEITRDRTLFELAERIQNAPDQANASAAILAGLAGLGYDRSRFYRYDGDRLVSTASRGMRELESYFNEGNVVHRRGEVGHRNAWLAIEQGRPILLLWDPTADDQSFMPEWDSERRFSIRTCQDAHREEMGKQDVLAWLDLPLIAGGRILGKITVDLKYSKRSFTRDDYESLTTFSRFVAQIHGGHAARAELQQRVLELDALVSTDLEMARSTTLHGLLKSVLSSARDVLGAWDGHIRLFDKASGKLMLAAAGEYEMCGPRELELGAMVSGRVAQQAQPYIVDDVAEDDYSRELRRENPPGTSFGDFLARERAFACIPLMVANEVVGTLVVCMDRAGQLMARRHLLEGIAAGAATAIQAQENVARIQNAVRELARVIAVRDVKELYRQVTVAAVQVLEAEDGAYSSYSPERNIIIREARCLSGRKDEDTGKETRVNGEVGAGFTRYVGATRDTVNLWGDGIKSHAAWNGSWSYVDTDLPSGRLHSVMVCPFVTPDGRLIGVLKVENKKGLSEAPRFSEFDESLLRAMSTAFAIAIDNLGLMQAKTQFLDRVTHDLKSPLQGITGAIAVLQDVQELPRPADSYYQMMQGACNQMITKVNTLLEISAGADPRRLVLRTIELRELIDTAVRDYDLFIQDRSLLVIQGKETHLPPLKGDRERLLDVLRNLLDNAIKYSREGGCIWIAEKMVNGQAIVSVTDEGPGIPRGELEKVFEPFYVGAEAKRAGSTGLGLAAAKYVIEAHGGEIWAENPSGGGCRVTFSFPLESAAGSGGNAGPGQEEG